MGGHNCAKETQKGSPDLGLSTLYSANTAAKLKNDSVASVLVLAWAWCGWCQQLTVKALLVHDRGAEDDCMPSVLPNWMDLIPRFNIFPLPNPSLSAHKLMWATGELYTFHISWNSKDKHFDFLLPSLTSVTFQISYQSLSLICCAGELLSECRSGDFPLSITINKPTSSLIH